MKGGVVKNTPVYKNSAKTKKIYLLNVFTWFYFFKYLFFTSKKWVFDI